MAGPLPALDDTEKSLGRRRESSGLRAVVSAGAAGWGRSCLRRPVRSVWSAPLRPRQQGDGHHREQASRPTVQSERPALWAAVAASISVAVASAAALAVSTRCLRMGRSEQSPLASRSPPLAAAMEGQAAPPTRGRDRAVAVLRHLPSNVVRARGQAGTVPRSLQGRSESRWRLRRRSRSTPAGSAGSLDARHSRRCASQSSERRILELRESGAAPRSDALANDA